MPGRQTHLDFVQGLLIIRMVVGHIASFSGLKGTNFWQGLILFFTFFMPWFFFKSGMFFSLKNYFAHVTNIVLKLLLPFVIFSVIGIVVSTIPVFIRRESPISFITHQIKEVIFEGSLMGNKPLWFLLTLCMVQLIAPLLIRRPKVGIAFCPLLFLCSYLLDLHGIRYPLYLANTISGLAFFILGYTIRSMQYGRIAFAISFFLYFFLLIFFPTVIDMRTNEIVEGSYLIWPIISISGIVATNNISLRLHLGEKIQWMSNIGRNSMFFLVWHWPFTWIIMKTINHFQISMSPWGKMLITSCFVGIFLFSIFQIKQRILRNCGRFYNTKSNWLIRAMMA